MKNIFTILLLTAFLFSCGPSGATRNERAGAEKQEAIADDILKKPAINPKDLERAFAALMEAEHGYRDDEIQLARVYSKKGFIRYLQKKYSESLNILRSALKYDPKLQAPYVFIVRIYAQRNEYASAIGWAARGLERHPHQVELLIHAGVSYYRQKNYRQAEEYLQRAVTAGAAGQYLIQVRTLLTEIRKLMQSGSGTENLQEFIVKSILTFGETAQIIERILPVKEMAQKRRLLNQVPSDSFQLMESLKIYDRGQFLRDKYVSRGDFAYILCRLAEFFKSSSLNVAAQYTDNPGIPDLKKEYYAFPHVLYVIEQNFIQLLDDGRYGTLNNLNGEVCVKSLKSLKERFAR